VIAPRIRGVDLIFVGFAKNNYGTFQSGKNRVLHLSVAPVNTSYRSLAYVGPVFTILKVLAFDGTIDYE
jgi:hypothetical protein